MPDKKKQNVEPTSLSTIYYAAIMLLVVILIGVVGYRVIEDYTFIESLFMVIITVATVGYKEV